MSELDAHLVANPLASRDAETLRAALAVLAQLRQAGLVGTDAYDLAPSFGGKTITAPRPTLTDMRVHCER